MAKRKQYSKQELDAVFGKDSTGNTPRIRARSSKRRWVRSQDHLAIDSQTATGLKMSSTRALKTFGMETLVEALDYACAIIVSDRREPAATIITKRTNRNWSQARLAKEANVTLDQVQDAESVSSRTPMKTVLLPICKALELDPYSIGFEKEQKAAA